MSLKLLMMGGAVPAGEALFTSSGTWVCPAGVTEVSVVCVGGGAGGVGNNLTPGNDESWGGAGGGLSYSNNVAVTPGNSYTVTVATQTLGVLDGVPSTNADGGDSSFADGATTLVLAKGGNASDRTLPGVCDNSTLGIGDARYDGGNGGTCQNDGTTDSGSGGGGAAGYSGNGGKGGNDYFASAASRDGGNGSGGGGGGGSCSGFVEFSDHGGGGGVGIFGEGTSGTGGSYGSGLDGRRGNGGSGAEAGTRGTNNTWGSDYGGGGGGDGPGAPGAVRIIWGPGRAFPSTNTG